MEPSGSEIQITGYAPRWQGVVVLIIGLLCVPVLAFTISFGHCFLVLVGILLATPFVKAVYGYYLKFDKSLQQVEVVRAWFYIFKSHTVRQYYFHEIYSVAFRDTAGGDESVEVSFRDRKTYCLHPQQTREFYDSLCRIVGCEKGTIKQVPPPPPENQITGYSPSWQGDLVCLIALVCAPVLIFLTSLEYAFPIVIGTIIMLVSGKVVYGHHLNFDQSLQQVEVVPAWFYFFKSHAVGRYDFTQIRYAALRDGADGTNLVEVAFRDQKTYGLFPGDTLKYYDSLCRMVGCEKLELGVYEKVVDG